MANARGKLKTQMEAWYQSDNPRPFHNWLRSTNTFETSFCRNYLRPWRKKSPLEYSFRLEKYLGWILDVAQEPSAKKAFMTVLDDCPPQPGTTLSEPVYSSALAQFKTWCSMKGLSAMSAKKAYAIGLELTLTEEARIWGLWFNTSTFWLDQWKKMYASPGALDKAATTIKERTLSLHVVACSYHANHQVWPLLFSDPALRPLALKSLDLDVGYGVLATYLPKEPLALLQFSLGRIIAVQDSPESSASEFGEFEHRLESDLPEWRAFATEDWMLTRMLIKEYSPKHSIAPPKKLAPPLSVPSGYEGLSTAIQLGTPASDLLRLIQEHVSPSTPHSGLLSTADFTQGL